MADSSSEEERREALKNPYLYDPQWEPYMAEHCDVKVIICLVVGIKVLRIRIPIGAWILIWINLTLSFNY